MQNLHGLSGVAEKATSAAVGRVGFGSLTVIVKTLDIEASEIKETCDQNREEVIVV